MISNGIVVLCAYQQCIDKSMHSFSCHIQCTLTAFFVFEQAKKQYAGGDHEAAYRSSHTAAAISACMLCCAAPFVTVLPIAIVLVFAVLGIKSVH